MTLFAVDWVHSLARLPIALVLAVVGLAAMGLRYVYLFAQTSRSDAADTRPTLEHLHRALRDYASTHGGAMPASLAELEFNPATPVTLRPVARADADEKVLIAHDAGPSATVIQFPYSRPARHVLFWSGRVRLVSESIFERLIEADDAFRAKLGIHQAPTAE